MTALANVLAFWRRDEYSIELESGMDEVSLALVADAWSRTYRSSAKTTASTPGAGETRDKIRIIPDRTNASRPGVRRVSIFPGLPPAEALDHTLDAIAARYGERTTNMVAMQLEYRRH
uniref:hypothetical protein n=1 Tax=Bradyrhizobium canariense TaxID=255045 RepID=UPI001CA481E6|nr:hypothetical protein [Bradyrhizobium canariense]